MYTEHPAKIVQVLLSRAHPTVLTQVVKFVVEQYVGLVIIAAVVELEQVPIKLLINT